MKPVEITKGIYSVGVADFNIRDFHGYSTEAGTTYNAFLIIDEKVALIDTVKKEFADELLANISAIIDPKKIDIVISNHTEMDHSGALPRIMHYIGEDKPLYCSKMGKKNLSAHFSRSWNLHPVQNGEELSLGSRTLMFMETRMLHWPDNMFTYVKEDEILFSSDAFGQHYAGYELYDDVLGDEAMVQARKYFANILMLYAPQVLKLMAKVTDMGLCLKMICPDHGVFWRSGIGSIIDAYVRWSRHETSKRAVVIYDTMWKSTQKMAEAIADGISETGTAVSVIHIRSSHRSEIMTAVLDSRAVVVGSPTLNNCMFPTVADVLTYMKGLRPKNRIGAAFGSYGWSGEAVKQMNKELEAMGMELLDEGLKILYVPDGDAIASCREYGKKIGEAVCGRK